MFSTPCLRWVAGSCPKVIGPEREGTSRDGLSQQTGLVTQPVEQEKRTLIIHVPERMPDIGAFASQLQVRREKGAVLPDLT